MVQIISISEARNTLPSLIKQIERTNTSIVIVRGSKPSAVLKPYINKHQNKTDHLNDLLSIQGDWFSQDEYHRARPQII